VRAALASDLLPTLLTPIVQRVADDGQTLKYAWRLHDGARARPATTAASRWLRSS